MSIFVLLPRILKALKIDSLLHLESFSAMSIDIINKGLINRNREMPADLMATNSKLSPKFPKVMMDEIKIAKGRASGIAVTVT
jgi:hypothetical protein